MEDIKKMQQKENIMTIILIILILIAIFIIIFVYTNKDKQNIVEQPQQEIEKVYVKTEKVDTTDYLTIYEEVDLEKLTFVNIPEILVSNFYQKQEEIINTIHNNIELNKEFIDKYNKDNNITNYDLNSKIDSNNLIEKKDNILSVLYLVEDNVDYVGLKNYIINIFIDVSTNTLMSNNTILEKYNITTESICSKIMDRVIEEHEGNIIDKETKNETPLEEIKNKKEEYIKKLTENFDTYIYPYFYQNNLYFKFNKHDIANFLFNEDLKTAQYSTLKV